jgi:hypothetical protein
MTETNSVNARVEMPLDEGEQLLVHLRHARGEYAQHQEISRRPFTTQPFWSFQALRLQQKEPSLASMDNMHISGGDLVKIAHRR